MQYAAWPLFLEEGFLPLPEHTTTSRDFEQNNSQTEPTDFQVHEVASKAQAVSVMSLGFVEKPFLTAQRDMQVKRSSTGAGGSSQFPALCQEDHTSYFSLDVLFHQKALSEQISRVFYPLWHLDMLYSRHRCTDSVAQRMGSTSGKLGYLPCAVSPTLSGKDGMHFCMTFYSRSVEISHGIPAMWLMC